MGRFVSRRNQKRIQFIKMSYKKIALVFAFCSLIIAFFVNEINIDSVRNTGIPLRENQTVITIDDDSYLNPFKLFVQTGTIYEGEHDKYSSLVRPPGYGIIYATLAKIFGEEKTLISLKIFQLLIFGLSVYCLFFISLGVVKSQRLAIISTGIYAILPLSMGFLYYTLTESITPALVICYVFFLLKASDAEHIKTKRWSYFFASLLFAYLFLTRPFLGILGIALPCFLFSDFYSREKPASFFKHLVLYGAVSISFMLIWQIRNYNTIGRFTELNPIYQNEVPGTFRKTHKAIWYFFKGWENIGTNFHGVIVPLYGSSIRGDTADIHIDAVISKMPAEVVNHFGKEKLVLAFKDYQQSTVQQKEYMENHTNMPADLLPTEQKVIETFNGFESEYKKHFWFRYHVITPLKVFKTMAFHSNLSLYVFQKPLRGNFFMETLRVFCFTIHSLVFILCLFFVFFSKNFKHISLFGIAIFIYIFYLIYFQRGIEERYTLPILPLVIISAAFVVKEIILKVIPKLKQLRQ